MKDFRGYIYKITNLINNKWYIGSHISEYTSINSAVNDKYWGGGVALNHAYKKYGKSNFKKEILCFSEFCRSTEEDILTKINASGNKMSYNLKNSAIGFGSGESNPNSRLEVIAKKSGENNHMRKNPDTLKGDKNGMWGKKGELNPNKGRKHRPEDIKKWTGDNHFYRKNPEKLKENYFILNRPGANPDLRLKMIEASTKTKIRKSRESGEVVVQVNSDGEELMCFLSVFECRMYLRETHNKYAADKLSLLFKEPHRKIGGYNYYKKVMLRQN